MLAKQDDFQLKRKKEGREQVLAIGIGNEYRRDDGVGIFIVRQLSREAFPWLQVVEAPTDGMALLHLWQNFPVVYVFDAMQGPYPPGFICRFSAHREKLPAENFSLSTHAGNLAEVIELARQLGMLPHYLVVYAVQGQNFGHGLGLSPPVAEAARKLVRLAGREMERLRSGKFRPLNASACP